MRRLTAAVGLALALAGCGHSAAFVAPRTGSDRPFAGGSPRRLTFNLGDDYAPAWLPDASGIVYALVRLDTPHAERCLGWLAATGGTRSRVVCDRAPGYSDSVTVFEEPAVAADGRLAYVASRSAIGKIAPDRSALVLGTIAAPTDVRLLRSIPYTAPNGTPHDAITQVHWLDTHSLVYLAERVDYPRPCSSCRPDTLRTGLEIVRLDLSGGPAALQVVPGTSYATGVAPGESADVIYYTLVGESRVHRRVISSGTDSVVHDFATGIARDVTVVGARLAAVVGGNVSLAYDSVLGHPVQRDGGGPLYLVDLASGAETVLPGPPALFHRPVLAPAGKQLVAAAVAANLDLWVFDLP
jgi:WD40 repeat protein